VACLLCRNGAGTLAREHGQHRGSLLWTAVGFAQREPSLVVLQGAFTAINVLGIYRWFG
jgi:hypothetical protein